MSEQSREAAISMDLSLTSGGISDLRSVGSNYLPVREPSSDSDISKASNLVAGGVISFGIS